MRDWDWEKERDREIGVRDQKNSGEDFYFFFSPLLTMSHSCPRRIRLFKIKIFKKKKGRTRIQTCRICMTWARQANCRIHAFFLFTHILIIYFQMFCLSIKKQVWGSKEIELILSHQISGIDIKHPKSQLNPRNISCSICQLMVFCFGAWTRYSTMFLGTQDMEIMTKTNTIASLIEWLSSGLPTDRVAIVRAPNIINIWICF